MVYQSLALTSLSGIGVGFALGALLSMTVGTLQQKRIRQAPVVVLPMQYLVTLVLCLLFAPFQPVRFERGIEFLIPVLLLGLVTSCASQLLLYEMIRSRNLVNVTSLLYLVPVVTVILDYLLLGNSMPTLAMVGMSAILAGLVLVFRPWASKT